MYVVPENVMEGRDEGTVRSISASVNVPLNLLITFDLNLASLERKT